YDGENLFFVFQSIVNGSAPAPRTVAPEIVPGLEGVIMRAMNVDPKARYRSVKHLGRALLPFSSARARVLWEEPFRTAVVEAAEPGGDLSQPTIADAPAEPPVAGAPASTQAGVETVDLTSSPQIPAVWKKFFALGLGLAAAGLVAIWVTSGKPEPAPKVVVVAPPASVPAAVAPPASAPAPTPPSRPVPPPEFHVQVSIAPDTATWELDGAPIEAGGWEADFPFDHKRHVLRAMAPGYETREEVFTDAPPTEHWVLKAKAAPPRRPPLARPAAPPREAEPVAAPPPVINPNGAPVID
ncbi:MAG TPA: hypothetical protein VHU40_01690, partial [Polyangia bacterium]|nr:hypothetical protein [Polyangia bacterium]